jgi:hypothetical protein
MNKTGYKLFQDDSECLAKNPFVYLQPLHLLHLFERYDVSASAFPWSFQFIPWKTKTDLQRNYLATLFPAQFSMKLTLSLYFPTNGRKPTERLSF